MSKLYSAYDKAALGDLGDGAPSVISAKAPNGALSRPVVGGSDAPAYEISEVYPYQSYFDSTLLNRALLEQPTNEPIVRSTLKKSNTSGYAVGLHPSSQTPVAVRFITGSQQGSTSAIRIKPGQIVRPHGGGAFSGIEYGLPFGWLGGGSALLVVFRAKDANAQWYDHNEVIFHRQRMTIYAPADVPASTALLYNWPMYFPWPQAVATANDFSQRGASGGLAVVPTRTTLMLRLATLANPADFRAYFIGTDDFAQLNGGVVDTTAAPAAVDMTWGSWASIASANYATQYQTMELTGQIARLQAPNGAVVFVSSNAALQGQFVDVVRYGRL